MYVQHSFPSHKLMLYICTIPNASTVQNNATTGHCAPTHSFTSRFDSTALGEVGDYFDTIAGLRAGRPLCVARSLCITIGQDKNLISADAAVATTAPPSRRRQASLLKPVKADGANRFAISLVITAGTGCARYSDGQNAARSGDR